MCAVAAGSRGVPRPSVAAYVAVTAPTGWAAAPPEGGECGNVAYPLRRERPGRGRHRGARLRRAHGQARDRHCGPDRNEFKRRQGAIGIKITPRAFGKDWRLPIVNKFRE